MTENQKEACGVLIEHARTKEEVIEAMLGAFPRLTRSDLKRHVSKEWKKRYELLISLRNKTYKEQFNTLYELVAKKKKGELKQILIHLNKGLDKSLSKETYSEMVGKGNLKWPGRSDLRGKEVELIGFSENLMRIIVKSNTRFTDYSFLIFDISKTHLIKVIK